MGLKAALERLNLAYGQDSRICLTKADIGNHAGNTPEYLEELGLEKRHLKRLERAGVAIRAYTKNIWLPGEQRPDGSCLPEKALYTERGRGHRVRWLLIKGV